MQQPPMKIALHYEMEVDPRSYTEYDIWHNVLEQIVAGERAGFWGAFSVEHHFNPGYSHVPAPEILLAAASQRTKTIRLGTAVRLLPLNDPIHTAESFASIDILSNGRLEFGVGRGVSEVEFEIWKQPSPYGETAAANKELFLEYCDLVRKCWTEENVTFHGKYYQVTSPVTIVPKPLQKPAPRMWASTTSRTSQEQNLGRGMHMLTGTILGGFENITGDTASAREVWKKFGHDRREALEVGCMVPLFCAKTTREAMEMVRPHHAYYIEQLCRFFAPRDPEERRKRLAAIPPGRKPYWEQPPSWEQALSERMIIVGSPDDCIRQIREYERAGITLILGLMQMGGIAHDKVMRSIELMGREVIPHLAKG